MVRRDIYHRSRLGFTNRKHARVRCSCVLVGHILGEKIKGVGSWSYNSLGYHRKGCDVVFHGYIYLPFCTRDDPESWTGECNRLSLRCNKSHPPPVCLGDNPTSSGHVSHFCYLA